MSILDVTDFVELLAIQNDRTRDIDLNETTTTQTTLSKHIENKKEEEFRNEIESKYKPEELPKDYFFSALAELVLL